MTSTDSRSADPEAGPDTAVLRCEALCGSASGTSASGVSRRAAIAAGLVSGAALIAGCGSSAPAATTTSADAPSSTAQTSLTSASSSSTLPGASASETPDGATAGAESAAASSPAATDPATASASPPAPAPTEAAPVEPAPTGTEIAKLANVPAGGSLIVTGNDRTIALAKTADGTVVAHTAVCTHQAGIVFAEGATLICPRHGSMFDAFTGAVTKSPADSALAEIAVQVSGESVYLPA
jgi:nitrite reductase/ring-hydroxylating ferredoxin subunit